jgi:long-chain acyl-CoA synthetase
MLFDILRNTAEKVPDKTAIVFDEERISFRELCLKAEGLAKGLSSLGILPGDCIALILPNCPEFIVSFFAAAKLQAVVLPVNPVSVEEELKHYVRDSRAVFVITDGARLDLCRTVISSLDSDVGLIVTDTLSAEILFHDLVDAGFVELDRLSSGAEDALYQYSSGSTGRPKRVSRTQENLLREAENFQFTVKTSPEDNILCMVPLFHAHGLGNCMLAAVYAGSTLILLEELRKDGVPVTVSFALRRNRVLELIENEKVTILPGVPFIFSALAGTPADRLADFSNLKLCFSAGNFLPQETFNRFLERFNIPIRQLYGCTEVGSFSINMDDEKDFHSDSVGLPMKNNQVKIIDASGAALPVQVIGEIAIKSGALTGGYCNRPDINQDAFREGFFFTGDLGRVDDQGRLFITGRKKIFIETAGNKVDPLEVEDVLIAHPKVKEVVVVGVKGPFGGEVIKAVVVLEGACKEQEILSYCKDKLASSKIPQILEFREEIPKSPLGKILRKDLV